MSYLVYKKFGKQLYAYEVESYWDKKEKKTKKKSEYRGVVVDREKKIFRKPLEEKINAARGETERLIVDFGDGFSLHSFFRNNGFISLLENSFGKNANELFAMVCYRLCNGSAMRLARTWLDGSFIKYICKDANLSSQRISGFFSEIGEERAYRAFFKNYFASVGRRSSQSIVLDITALQNQIDMPLTTWGYHDEQIDKQIKLLLAVDKNSKMPLFFRYMPGSIADVSSLKTTINELKTHDVANYCSIMDAGFFSEENVAALQAEKINFIIRLPAGRLLYKQLINEQLHDLEQTRHAVRYGKRALYIKKVNAQIFQQNVFVYIIQDPERKGRETTKTLLQLIDEKDDNPDIDPILKTRGIMMLVSSFDVDTKEILSYYYARQAAEQLFNYAKEDLRILPLRVHKEESLRGYLLYIFVTLVAHAQIRKTLAARYTVEEAMLALRNIKAKVYENHAIITEPTKIQKQILEQLNVMVPNTAGI